MVGDMEADSVGKGLDGISVVLGVVTYKRLVCRVSC